MTAETGTSTARLFSFLDRRSRRLVLRPESLAGAVIVAVATTIGSLGSEPLLLVLALVGLAVWLHRSTIDGGSFVMMWVTTAWVLLSILASSRSLLSGAGPLVFAAAGLAALAYNELVRLSHGRRRAGRLEREPVLAIAVGFGEVALLTMLAIGIAEPLADGTGRSWLWLPAAAGATATVALWFVVVPGRRASQASDHRWSPGDRIAPRLDVSSLGRSSLDTHTKGDT